LTYNPAVFQVDKVLVTVCGDQVITNADPTNEVFAITGNKPIDSTWTAFSLDGIWTTQSAALPLNECPVNDIKVCEDSACLTELEESSGLRITQTDGSFALEVDKATVEADPQITRYFKVVSYSVEIIESFTVYLTINCSAQIISPAGEALAPIERDIARDNGLKTLFTSNTTASFFSVEDSRSECAISQYLLFKSTTEEITSADTALWSRLDGANYAEDGLVKINTGILATD
jgi:hypothetical protein